MLQINGSDVTAVSQLEAVTLLQSSDDTCTLEIEYDITVHGESLSLLFLFVPLFPPSCIFLSFFLSPSPTDPSLLFDTSVDLSPLFLPPSTLSPLLTSLPRVHNTTPVPNSPGTKRLACLVVTGGRIECPPCVYQWGEWWETW